MPRNWSKTWPEGNGPVPRQDEFRPDKLTLVDLYRRFEEIFDRQLKLMESRFDQ